MGIGPIFAIPKVLKATGLSKDDVDIWEVNRFDLGTFAIKCTYISTQGERGFRITVRILYGDTGTSNG
jgi:hypothetical protein